ncbi:MAG: ribokinase [Patescibacteria group bacterium]
MSKVIVAGSINMDIVILAQHHPKIGETVFGDSLKYFFGGKGANQAIAAAKLGAQTLILGKVGSDTFGEELISNLKQQDIETHVSVGDGASSGTAIITVAAETSNNTIVVIPGANFLFSEKDIQNVNPGKGDILVSQFEIPEETITAFFKKGRVVGAINIFNPAPARTISRDLLDIVDILILNETELSYISNRVVDVFQEESIRKAVETISRGNLSVVVTIGEKGVMAFKDGAVINIAGKKVTAIDTTGAGDCFVGAIAASLAGGSSFKESLLFANVAASISVTRAGAGSSMPSLDEVRAVV